ncbi:colanic acid/amylovoran biosynthesis glycosyltransferase [Anaerolineae bacterium]|nr:colanic acid/amylovoran biosynthesis glycosyltransferase [Anaerolineae bacterium]
MTIAYILKMYPRFSETFILNEILELERQGVDVRIYSLRKPDDGRFHANLARVRAPVTYLPEYLPAEARRVFAAQRAVFRADPRRYARVLGYALSRGNLHALKRFFQAVVLADDLRARPVTHLHAHFASSATRVAMFVRLLTGAPYSFTAHAKDIFLNTVDADLLRDKIRAARFVVTVSAFNHAYLTRLVNQEGSSSLDGLLPRTEMAIPPDRIHKLYNGIDLAQFDPAADYVPHPQRDPLILGIGRLVEKKGFDDLIRACAQLRDRGMVFHCEIVGKGPQEAALRALVAELGLGNQVRLVGPKSQDDVIAAYRRAAVFALPCVVGADGNRDGLPTVLLEAMAMRVPVVSTDVTGVPEIINPDVTGLLTPQNNAAALADALARLLADAALRERMGDAARAAVAQKFDLQKNVAVLRDWITAIPSFRFSTTDAPSQSAIGNRQTAIP